MANNFRSKLTVCTAPANPSLNTHYLFDAKYKEPTGSPISEFLTRLHNINRLSPPPASFDPLQGQLVLLGVIAAVESYLRTLFRKLIALDSTCQESVEKRDVSFGAAIHLPKEMLPEAILERISFISRDSIVSALKELLAVKGHIPPDLEVSIADYVRICQLRHCAVHRFGKLGVSNAIVLGLANHRGLLEKPLKLDYANLQNAIAISTGLVKTINNFLFNEMLSRIPLTKWSGVYAQDRDFFLVYYKLFADKVSSIQSAEPKKIYLQLRKQHALYGKGKPF
jgi:hypothetical protein